MKEFFSKVNQVIKASVPYTALLAVIIGIVNLIVLYNTKSDISDIESDVEYTYSRLDDVESAVQNINTDYDNSEIVSIIGRAHNSIINHIDDAESNINSNIMIWSD